MKDAYRPGNSRFKSDSKSPEERRREKEKDRESGYTGNKYTRRAQKKVIELGNEPREKGDPNQFYHEPSYLSKKGKSEPKSILKSKKKKKAVNLTES